VAISPYIKRLRASVGHELLLLPSVTVLPRDKDGRVLLVRQADTEEWMTIGGLIEVDEDPSVAAIREAREEAGVTVELRTIVRALGGPQYRLKYSNGDHAAYVTTVYDATVIDGTPTPDGDETDDAAWFFPHQLRSLNLSTFARAQLADLGWL
jgi:8-oxo-dGTP pyrophosphatase MutT (NUDIX family)